MPVPLTEEQYVAAKKAGFSHEQIIANEKIRLGYSDVGTPDATAEPYLPNPTMTRQENGMMGSIQPIDESMMMTKQGLKYRDPRAEIKYRAEMSKDSTTADMKNSAINTEQSQFLMNKLETLGSNLEGGYGGMKAIGKTWVDRGKGDKSSDMKLYLGMMPMAAVALYRAVSGDNRLSDQDASTRALPLLWHPSEDKDVRDKKFSFTKELMSAREILLKGGKFTLDEETGNKITPFAEVSDLANKISAAKKEGYSDEEIKAYFGSK